MNDEETFANVLQRGTNKPVYNLAVSSYGTHREIKRLIKTGLIKKVDTIVIQYCENDIGENEKINNPEAFESERAKFKNTFLNSKPASIWEKTKLILISLRAAVSIPFKSFKTIYSSKNNDFTSHHLYLNRVLKFYENELKDKKIVIFYVNGYGENYYNFPNGRDLDFPNITYHDFQKNLDRDNFYVVDGHLNAKGHKTLGNNLLNFLNGDK